MNLRYDGWTYPSIHGILMVYWIHEPSGPCMNSQQTDLAGVARLEQGAYQVGSNSTLPVNDDCRFHTPLQSRTVVVSFIHSTMRAGEGQNRQEEEGMLSQMCVGGSQALPEIWAGRVQHRNGCRPQSLTRQRNSMSREEVHLCDEFEELRSYETWW